MEFQKIDMKMKEIKAAMANLGDVPRTQTLPKVRWEMIKFNRRVFAPGNAGKNALKNLGDIERRYNRHGVSFDGAGPVVQPKVIKEEEFSEYQSTRRGSFTGSLPSDITSSGSKKGLR